MSDLFFSDALLRRFYNSVQDELFNILSSKPYLLDQPLIDKFLDYLLNLNSPELIYIVTQNYNKKSEYATCADEIIKKFYDRIINNLKISNKIKDYCSFVDDAPSKFDGKYAFYILLSVLNGLNVSFIEEKNSNSYLNVENFLLFFKLDINSDVLSNNIRHKVSLTNTYEKLISKKFKSLFIGLSDEYVFTYGFITFDNEIFKTGEFKYSQKFLNSIFKFDCIKQIKEQLSLNTFSLLKLHKIKKDFDTFLNDKYKSFFVNDKIILKKIPKNNFKNVELTYDQYISALIKFCDKHKWCKNVYPSVDITDENVGFYLKIKNTSK